MSRLHRLRYFCSDAWDEWRHSIGVNLMALSTLTAALFVAGLVMLIATNIDGRVRTLRDDVKIEIYLQDGVRDPQRQALAARLRAIEDVERVDFIDKKEALRRYREWATELADLVNELDTNPLPASLVVYLRPGSAAGERAAAIAEHLDGDPAVEEVRFNQEWLARLESVLALARYGGMAVVAIVFAAVVLVMGSVLRLAVFARREEIGIMQLVGATPAFIRGPYLVAGAIQGLAAAIGAWLLLELMRSSVRATSGPAWSALVDLVAAASLPPAMAGLLLLLGLLVGLAGSYVSVRQAV